MTKNNCKKAHSPAQCLDERAAKLSKVLSASSYMTAVLEDTVFRFNLITMPKLQPASTARAPDSIAGINKSPLISLAYYWLFLKELG